MEGELEPYVTFKPTLQLHVDDETLIHAGLGDPESIFKIAHEIGHIILHDHYAFAFSIDPTVQIKFAEAEESAEWQANRFAYHLLLPDVIVRQLRYDLTAIIEFCNVTQQVAIDRIEEVRKCRRSFDGQPCPECANFTLLRAGTCLKCHTCGSTTGCS